MWPSSSFGEGGLLHRIREGFALREELWNADLGGCVSRQILVEGYEVHGEAKVLPLIGPPSCYVSGGESFLRRSSHSREKRG